MTDRVADPALLRRYALLLWDFDGVIKDSLAIKADAFERLFRPFGHELAARVKNHHERNGGVSRYEKFRLYLAWAGLEPSTEAIAQYCDLFSRAVCQAVIDCDWVPGAREYLEANHGRQTFVLVTATPQAEIETIVESLGIMDVFRQIYGAPLPKAHAIEVALAQLKCSCGDALFIGDSEADYEAAKAAGVAFLLRRTPFNGALQEQFAGPQCEWFPDEPAGRG